MSNKFSVQKICQMIEFYFDFKDHKIIPTDYTLKSNSSSANVQKPKSWVIEGSNDNNSWEVIDEQVNYNYYNYFIYIQN